jgi:hypothetical protein
VGTFLAYGINNLDRLERELGRERRKREWCYRPSVGLEDVESSIESMSTVRVATVWRMQ